ncbi:energy-coupling factor transporter transmembrane component T [Luxibacter massiliensis]|uniref:energy-coupling factor transporter transmembrane component T n=1 Tax=Luxibacter massiliensis TaxID=2219695 RepID=UPI000F057A5B|nr:energy-coupling factor transporter transmembrane component T [Luxibacter massiliensis]
MRRQHFAVPVKLWALVCTIVGVSLAADTVLTCVLAGFGFVYLGVQRNWRLLRSMGAFYALLALLLYLIRFHGFHMVVFSEFYALMFWNLMPVFIVSWDLITTPPGKLAAFLSRIHTPTPMILGLLVVFRFFPTMKAELRSVWQSMRNRGLTAPAQLASHPAASCEYVLVPLLLRCLQIADQLSVSAVARGAERPGKRGSYFEKKTGVFDYVCMMLWTAVTAVFLGIGGIRI